MQKIKRAVSIMLTLCMMVGMISACGVASNAVGAMPEIKEYGFIESNGAKIEYGVYGVENGEPLLIIPGNKSDMHGFDGNILPELAQHYRVITISTRGTGNSELGEGKLTFEKESQDLVNLLDYLKVEKTNIFGFSDGGNLALVFTVQHQDRVKSLAVMGANINAWGTNTGSEIAIIWQYFILCIEAFFTGDQKFIVQREIKGMMVGQPNLTFDDISKITVPVLNIYGEFDMIKRSHLKKITKSIPGAKEIMIKGAGHGSFEYTDSIINPALLDFFGTAD